MALIALATYLVYQDNILTPALKISFIIFIIHFIVKKINLKIDNHFKTREKNL